MANSPLLTDAAACLNVRARMSLCADCRDACAGRALSLSPDGIAVDPKRCSACGACVPKCPVGAISLSGFSPRDFLRPLQGQAIVHIHCSASRTPERGVAVPCHGILDARLLAAAHAAGTVSFQLHGLSQCGPCPMGSALAGLASLQETLQSWFGQRAPEVSVAPENQDQEQVRRWQQDRAIRSRRGFLRGAGLRASVTAAARLLPSGQNDNPDSAARPPPPDPAQQRPAAYQALLRERVADLSWQQLPWRQRSIGEKCDACLVCAQRCPTGALTAWHKPTARGIDFEPGLCTSCRLCEWICPQRAIVTGEVASVSAVAGGRTPLVVRPLAVCTACGRTHVSAAKAAGLCLACRKEADLKTAWLGLLEKS